LLDSLFLYADRGCGVAGQIPAQVEAVMNGDCFNVLYCQRNSTCVRQG
jgi:hypothetical protein